MDSTNIGPLGRLRGTRGQDLGPLLMMGGVGEEYHKKHTVWNFQILKK